MKAYHLICPSCGANLSGDETSTYLSCSHCGTTLYLERSRDNVIFSAKIKLAELENARLQMEIEANEKEKKRQDEKEKNENSPKKIIVFSLLFVVMMSILFSPFVIILKLRESESNKEQERLEAIYSEILLDIENEDYVEALAKAQTLQYSLHNIALDAERQEQWDARREAIISVIQEAMK